MDWKITDEVFETMAGAVRLTINGFNVEAPQDQSLLVTIRQQGIDIPTLCHHSDLPSEGHCRLCVVEIGEYPKTRIVNSCTYPTEGGLVVQTHSEPVLQARRMVLELLLARCPHAKLIQEMAAEHGVYESRFKTDDPDELCILCGLCVRACRDIVGVSAISMKGRTPDKQVTTPFSEKSSACIGCGSCAFICPTDVIPYTEKDGIRTVWGRDFELQPCLKCGNYIAPKAQLEHWAKITGDPVESFFTCRDCR
ncbi:MAG: 2Fe-2S iron-sulfur cluster-binding protein [Syntrophobacterales bacterium]|jgi:NADH dehydrogenase/NADH:ubiquinone oxidoreductase subunit G|nr:2Fe-2S iron-sulfur cluster-binding protein [Syntrophobacterales bacterium]